MRQVERMESNISHLMEPIVANASVTGEVLGTPNATLGWPPPPTRGRPCDQGKKASAEAVSSTARVCARGER